jgi:hypothetical protein
MTFIMAVFLLPAISVGMDVYGPKPFDQILESNLNKTWTPSPISSIQNREHVILIDAATSSFCLKVNESDPSLLEVGDVSVLTAGTGTYGNAMRSMFQLLDLNTSELSTEDLTNTYTIHPWLGSYSAIDANTSSGSQSGSSITVRDKNSFYMLEQETIAFLVFTMTGTSTSTKVKATSRYFYNTELQYELDANWSSNQWLKIESNSVSLTNIESEATEFILADAKDLINVEMVVGSDFNPQATTWQTNSFANWPLDPQTGEESPWDYDDSSIFSDHFLLEVDDSFETQFGRSNEAASAASLSLDGIESTLINEGANLRYSKDVYLAFRDYLLTYKFAAEDMYNSVLGESTVANVYFTNAADDEGTHHPFMVIASHNSPSGPQFLIDVARPPGDNCCEGGYPNQNITRNAVLEVKLVKIPLRDYGVISNLTDNDLSSYGTLASDMGLSESEWTTDNYASLNSSAIAVDGVLIYPASNNVLVYASFAAEITSSGIHVGRGMGFHYHADGHSFNGNGTNLYNLSDFEGHTHPPIIGFAFDGLALFGKYESSYNSMDGFGTDLDEYNGHIHGDYGYHYHAFATEVTQSENNSSETYIQHFLFRGAFKGSVNEIPGLFEVSTNQFMNSDIKRYVGAAGTVMDTDKDELSQFPQIFNLSHNYPNPFNPTTTIEYDLAISGSVDLAVYDLMGHRIRTLMYGNQKSGIKTIEWDATNDLGQSVSAGLYFYQLKTPQGIITKKMVLLK